MKELLVEIKEQVMAGEEEVTVALVAKALKSGVSPQAILQEALTEAMTELGEGWNRGEVFIPEVMAAAQVFQAAADYLEPHLVTGGSDVQHLGTVVIGTVKGDIHNLGKNLVAVMLRTAGFRVFDLGVDVPVEKFIDEAVAHQAEIIGASALLTTTMMEQKELIKTLEKRGLKERFKVMVGGAPVTEKWAHEIGADGYGRSAAEAVELAKKLVGRSE
ncbi:MAG: corrinoid protein [Firmicutes bacterium]|nr:corrinoid protein [Bacillota bacterium]